MRHRCNSLPENAPKRELDPQHFIHYQALGLAILRAKGSLSDDLHTLLSPAQRASLPAQPTRSLVLIDEIDKAPRDVPNDILHEIDKFEFDVPELINTAQQQGRTRIGLHAQQALKPVVIFTSNNERELPPAFLRRCVFCHVPFPPFSPDNNQPNEYSVENIVMQRLAIERYQDLSELQRQALAFCRYLREEVRSLKKQPGLAEMLNWLYCLNDAVLLSQLSGKADISGVFLDTAYSLFKHERDLQQATDLLAQWMLHSSQSSA